MEDNIPIQPAPVIKFKRILNWVWVLIAFAIAGIGFLTLKLAGNSFMTEIIQVIELNQAEDEMTIKQAPYFEADNLKGDKIRLSDFLGKPLLLIFWASWNQSSVDQLRIIDTEVLEDKDDIFEVAIINSQEDRSTVANFIKRGGYGSAVLLDVSGAVSSLYGARNLPVSYFIDKNGNIREVHIGVLSGKSIVDKVGKLLSQQ